MRLGPLTLITFAVFMASAPANAATVTRTFPLDPFGMPYGEGTAVFAAAPGELNQVEIRLDDEGVTLIDVNPVETKATSRFTQACTQVDPRTVRCARGGLHVDLGDGADTARIADARDAEAELNSVTSIEAGTGADAVTGGPLREVFVDGGAGEADRFSGNGGNDEVSYAGRATPVRVMLGTPGEDVLDSVPSVTGGFGDDVLIGDGGVNTLSGGAGSDHVDGGAGDDQLHGDGGDDRLLGGAGDDALTGDTYASATGRDLLDGGSGDDVLDLSAADDEQLSIGGPTYEPLPDGRRDVARCGTGTDTTSYRENQDVERGCEAIELDSGVAVAHRLRRVSRTHVRLNVVRGDLGVRVYLVPRRGTRTRLTRPTRRTSLALTSAGRRYLRRSGAVRIVIPSLDVVLNATVTR